MNIGYEEKSPTLNVDEKYLKDSRVNVLKLFDEIFLSGVVPMVSFLEFLKLHVSEKCALVLQEYSMQRLALRGQSSLGIDIEKINAVYGKTIPRSFLNLLGTLRIEFQSSGAASPVVTIPRGQSNLHSNLLTHCCIERSSASTFLTRYLLSSSINQSTLGRVLNLSQVFIFKDCKNEEKHEIVSKSDILSGEEKVKQVESILAETEAIISSIKQILDEKLEDVQFHKMINGTISLSQSVNTSDERSLRSSVHECVLAVETVQEKLRVVDVMFSRNDGGQEDMVRARACVLA